jgi:hypothetical protein
MKLKINSFVAGIILVGLIFSGLSLQAQNSKRLDSIIKVNTSKMYENPDAVIVAGNLVVNESGNDIDIKIRGYKLISDGYSSNML